MKLQATVGQIFLTHQRDQNYTSIYEEAFGKHGQSLDLFVIIEVDDPGGIKTKKEEYEKLSKAIVTTFKKSYITSQVLGEENFERSLAAVNAAISRAGSKNKVGWYGKLNAVVACLWGNQLSISTAGNARVYLFRQNELTLLSEGLAEDKPKPTKIFSNYATGSLANRDRVILSTNQIFNYLSIDRIREFLNEDTIDDTCQETINALLDVKDMGFATFVFEATTGQTPPAKKNFVAPILPKAAGPKKVLAILEITANILASVAISAWQILRQIAKLVITFFRRRPKKYLFIAIIIVLALFLGSIGVASWKNTGSEQQQQELSVIEQIETKLNEAEAALIYNDEPRIINLLADAEKLISSLGKNMQNKRQALETRLTTIKNKINKELRVDNPTVLTQFAGVPTDLLRSPNGILAFNRNSSSLSFYDFREGLTRPILQNQNTASLKLGGYLEGLGFIFYGHGKFQKLDVDAQSLSEIAAEGEAINISAQDMVLYGNNSSGRIYFLDPNQNQIWRLKISTAGAGPAEKWLKSDNVQIAEAKNLAIDGNIYLSFDKSVEKYFNGQKQTWQLSPVIPEIKNIARVFTRQEYQNIYVLEPDNKRVLVYNKQGKLVLQITSDKFHDLADISVDEKNQIIYALSGGELLQVNYK